MALNAEQMEFIQKAVENKETIAEIIAGALLLVGQTTKGGNFLKKLIDILNIVGHIKRLLMKKSEKERDEKIEKDLEEFRGKN